MLLLLLLYSCIAFQPIAMISVANSNLLSTSLADKYLGSAIDMTAVHLVSIFFLTAQSIRCFKQN